MYRPAAFDVPDLTDLHDLLAASGPATLVTAGTRGLDATVLPMLLDRHDGPFGTLRGHVARANPHWRAMEGGAVAVAIFSGPDAYVSPSWYPTKRETGRVVPTWNYVSVLAHGTPVVHHDTGWLAALVRKLTDRHERGRPDPWSVDDAPADYLDAMLRAIVGVELRITRLEGKRKLSQNRSPADQAGVLAGLASGTAAEQEVAAMMRAVLPSEAEEPDRQG